MSYSALKVREIVENAVSDTWSVPEFQRGFVWKTQVRDLAESLWLDYPIGNVLVWDSSSQKKAVSEKSITDSRPPTKWLRRRPATCLGPVHTPWPQTLLVVRWGPVEQHGEELRYPLRH